MSSYLVPQSCGVEFPSHVSLYEVMLDQCSVSVKDCLSEGSSEFNFLGNY